MPKLNRWLVMSIVADIKEFISVTNEMCSWVGEVDHSSWKFPSKSARNVNAMAIIQQHSGSAGEMYILLLEMAYDRIHFILRLVVEFMDSYPFIEDFFEELAKVKKPRSMSLANVIRVLWQRLKLIPETITRNMIKAKHLENSVFSSYTSRSSQASGSLFHCESCSSASKAIGNLTKLISAIMQENNLSSVVVTERDAIRADLFENTQWSVMTKLVEAINADVGTLLDTASAIRFKSEADAKEYEKSLQSSAAEVQKQKTEKNLLEMKIKGTTDQLRAVDSQLQVLKDNCAELVRENRTLIEVLDNTKEKLSNSETLLAITRQQVAEIAASKMALEDSVKHLHEEVTAVRQASIIETEELQRIVDHLRGEKILMEKQYHEEVESLKQEYSDDVKKLQEDNSKTSAADETAEILLFKSDPEVDMAMQLASNEKTIERLTRQNERLSRTLSRLKERRRILDIRRNVKERDRDV